MANKPLPRLLTSEELAEFLGVPKGTLYDWSSAGKGPTAIRVGKHLRYRVADVEKFLDENTKQVG